jgi:hypothetical protein
MKLRSLPALLITAALISAALTGCFQELPLGDKYLNEAAGFLRVQNSSMAASYIFTGLELRDEAGQIIQTWEDLGQDGQGLKRGETSTKPVDREGSFTLYCTIRNDAEKTEGHFEYGTVAIKLHEVTESKIMGETFLSDTDGDGYSDTWERANDFDPGNSADGGPVFVVSTGSDDTGNGTAASPYKTLAKGVEKAKYGLKDEARTVILDGLFTPEHGNTILNNGQHTEMEMSFSNTSVISIEDTGFYGVTVIGRDPALPAHINAQKTEAYRKRALYLFPGTKLTIKNIVIENGRALRGAGIYVDRAELILGEGAVIRNCLTDAGSSSGAAVHAFGASVVMKDRSLIGGDNNTDTDILKRDGNVGLFGSAVSLLNGSSLTMESGSSIRGNYYFRSAAVTAEVGSRITMEPGSEIKNNSHRPDLENQAISHGGGVHLAGGSKLIMNGGLIAGNKLWMGGSGGGVYVGAESVFEMRDGEISGNSAGIRPEGVTKSTETPGNGGGVYVDAGGAFLMTGGAIAANTAKGGKGGGVYIKGGSFVKRDGIIYGSTGGAYANTITAGNGYTFFAEPNRYENDTLSGYLTL